MTDVRVLVLPAFTEAPGFPGELAPWREAYTFEREVPVTGVPEPVRVTDRGLAVVPTGIGKTEAAATTAAILAGDELATGDAYVLSAGIAGGTPERTTVGAVHLADTVVDWDFKQRWDPADVRRTGAKRAASTPTGTAADGSPDAGGVGSPPDDSEGTPGDGVADHPGRPPIRLPEFRPFDLVYRPDEGLLGVAKGIADGVELADSGEARAIRAAYPTADDEPFLGMGTNVCGDEWWHGATMARQVEALVDDYGAGTYVLCESEDAATARTLQRFGRLDRYLSVRSVSNFDRPAPGGDVIESASDGGGGGAVAAENAHRVASAIADQIVADWAFWRDGPPTGD